MLYIGAAIWTCMQVWCHFASRRVLTADPAWHMKEFDALDCHKHNSGCAYFVYDGV